MNKPVRVKIDEMGATASGLIQECAFAPLPSFAPTDACFVSPSSPRRQGRRSHRARIPFRRTLPRSPPRRPLHPLLLLRPNDHLLPLQGAGAQDEDPLLPSRRGIGEERRTAWRFDAGCAADEFEEVQGGRVCVLARYGFGFSRVRFTFRCRFLEWGTDERADSISRALRTSSTTRCPGVSRSTSIASVVLLVPARKDGTLSSSLAPVRR